MDGWTDGWMGWDGMGWDGMDGWTDGWMDGWMRWVGIDVA